MISFAFAMGAGGSTSSGGGGFGAFIPLILIIALVFIGFRVAYRRGRKDASKQRPRVAVEHCGILYTKNEQFCKKCGTRLGSND